MGCTVCKDIAEWESVGKNKGVDNGGTPWTTVIKVRIARVTYKGRRQSGIFTDSPVDLNYCPKCGRKLKSEAGEDE